MSGARKGRAHRSRIPDNRSVSRVEAEGYDWIAAKC
jgi:hypothetical protein